MPPGHVRGIRVDEPLVAAPLAAQRAGEAGAARAARRGRGSGADTRSSASSRSQNFRWNAPTRGRMPRRSRRVRPPEAHEQVHVQRVDRGRHGARAEQLDDGARRRGVAPLVGEAGQEVLRDAGLRELLEVGRRQCGHEHADVDEQAHVRVVDAGDHLDRRARSAASRGSAAPGSPRTARGPARAGSGSEPTQQGLAGLADRQPDARARRRGARHAAGAGGRRGARPRSRRCAGPSQSSRLAPTMLTLPPAASRSRRSASTSASADDGERSPQLTRLELDDRRDAVGHDPDGDVGRRALGADHVGRPVEGARREGPGGGEFGRSRRLLAGQATSRETDGSGRRRHRARATGRCGTAG